MHVYVWLLIVCAYAGLGEVSILVNELMPPSTDHLASAFNILNLTTQADILSHRKDIVNKANRIVTSMHSHIDNSVSVYSGMICSTVFLVL